MKPQLSNAGKITKSTGRENKLKKKLKTALDKVKDKLQPNEFMVNLNSSANVKKPKAFPITSSKTKHQTSHEVKDTKAKQPSIPKVTTEQHVDENHQKKKKNKKKNKKPKVNGTHIHDTVQSSDNTSEKPKVNRTHSNGATQSHNTSPNAKPSNGLKSEHGKKLKTKEKKVAKQEINRPAAKRNIELAGKSSAKNSKKQAFTESHIDDYEQIFNATNGKEEDTVQNGKPKSAKKAPKPSDLTVAHRESSEADSDSNDEEYADQFFGDSADDYASYSDEDDYSNESDYSDEVDYSDDENDFDEDEYYSDDSEEDYSSEGDEEESLYDGESDDDSYSDYDEEYQPDNAADHSDDQEEGKNDDVRIAPGTAVTHVISEDQYVGIFDDESKTSIVEYGEVRILDNASPETAATRQMRELKREEIEQRDKQLFEERTREYWIRTKNIEVSATDTTMTAAVINCRQTELLDISLDHHMCEPPLKRSRISLSTSRKHMNDTILSTTGLNFTEDPAEVDNSVDEESEELQLTEAVNDTQESGAGNFSLQIDDTIMAEINEDIHQNAAISVSDNEEGIEIENNNASLLGRKSLISQQKPKFFNSTNSRHVLVLLRNKLYFNGHIHVTLIAGDARIFGYKLIQDKSIEVNSPKGFSLIFIEPLLASASAHINTKTIAQQLQKYTTDFLAQDIDYLLSNFNADTDALVLLERNRTNTAVHMTERYMKETFSPNIDSFNNDNYYYSSEFILHCRLSFRPRSGLIINDDWNSVKISATSKVFVVGGKSVGKSTAARYFINSHLNEFGKFLLIDLDIGQPEIFLPQTVSATVITEPILGPGFLHNIKPVKSFLYGDVNVLPSPVKYLKCVMDLQKFCASNAELAQMPWIVNTMGYTRGLGIELISSILKVFNPTDVVQIQGQNHRDNFDQAVNTETVHNCRFEIFKDEMINFGRRCTFKTHHFRSVAYRDNKKNPIAKDIRYAMILSKLGGILKSNSDWLSTVRPFRASLDTLKIIVPDNEIIQPENHAELLNGSLVYLCHTIDESNTQVCCYGIGLVRAIDKITRSIYLVSSVAGNDLLPVNALAICTIPLPSAVLLNQHNLVRGSVPFVYNTDDFVGSKQVVQRVYKPQGFNRTPKKSN